MAINRSECPYCAAEVASSNWHRHVKNCSVRTIQYCSGTKPISTESANISFCKCIQCELYNYQTAKQCVFCGFANDKIKANKIVDIRQWKKANKITVSRIKSALNNSFNNIKINRQHNNFVLGINDKIDEFHLDIYSAPNLINVIEWLYRKNNQMIGFPQDVSEVIVNYFFADIGNITNYIQPMRKLIRQRVVCIDETGGKVQIKKSYF
eukprot:68220_1